MPLEAVPLNMLKTNMENMGISQLLSPTYHCQISPLARKCHLVSRNNQLLEKFGNSEPRNPQLEAVSVSASAHTQKEISKNCL